MDQAVDPHLEGRVLKHAPYLVGFTRKILYLESFPDLVRRVAAKATAALSESGLCVLRQAVHPHRRIIVPDHAEAAKGTSRAIIKQTGLTVEEFQELL